MKRKAIQLANQTIVVSLPSKWVKQQGIKKGDEIDVEEVETKLVISKGDSVNEKKEAEINLINNSETTLGLLIGNLYWSGLDRIKINFNNFDKEKQYEVLKQKIKPRMIGFEIIKRGEDCCILEKIAEPSEEQFENVLRKLFLSIDELFELTESEFKNRKNISDYEEIEQRIFKYDNFCRRVVQKKKMQIKNYEMCLNFLSDVWNAQREIYYLNKFLEENKNTELPKDFLELIGNCRSFLKIMENSFFNKKIEPLGKIHELEPKIMNEKVYSLLKKNIKKGNIVLFRLGSCIRQLHLSTCHLMGFISN